MFRKATNDQKKCKREENQSSSSLDHYKQLALKNLKLINYNHDKYLFFLKE